MKLAIDLDGALGDTHGLWQAWLEDAQRRFRSIAALDVSSLPDDRASAAEALDAWAAHGIGDWRASLERFAEDHAPLHLRPDGAATSALRRLHASGARIVAFTDAPDTLAQVAASHLGVSRRVEAIEAGRGSLERALERLGDDAHLVGSREELLGLAP